MVGPVAVRPDVQRGGHGRALMDHMLEAARTMADGALMMIGDPEYYGRFFGFTADATGAWGLPGPYEKHRLLALADVVDQHQSILDAVAAGDAERAASLTRAHIEGARDRLLAHYDATHSATTHSTEGPTDG